MVFVPLWTVGVYAVVAHWVWAPGGWLFELGALDYAGGLVIEIVSGMSALALALVLGPRIGFKKDAMRPHKLPFVLLAAVCSGSAGSGSTPVPPLGAIGAASGVIAGLVAITRPVEPSTPSVRPSSGWRQASSARSRSARSSRSATTIRWTWSGCTSSAGLLVCC